MLQPIGVLMYVTDLLADAAGEMVTPKAIIIALASAVAALSGAVAAMGLHIAKSSRKHQEKVDELYEARISDLKEAHDLVDTLIGVLNPKRGGGS